MGSNINLIAFLVLNTLVLEHATKFSSPCTEDEMRKPKDTFFYLIAKIQKPESNANEIINEIDEVLNGVSSYIEDIKMNCGEEKDKSVESLLKLQKNIEEVHNTIKVIDTKDYEKAKNMIQNIHCIFIMHYLVQKYATSHESLDKLFAVMELMKDFEVIILFNNAIINVKNESKFGIGNAVIPIMKKQILENKDSINKAELLFAKHNIKDMVIRSYNDSFEGIIALNLVDEDLAAQAMYEVIYANVSEEVYIPAFDKVSNAPDNCFKIYGYRAIFDKLNELHMEHGLISGKVLILVNNIIKSEEVQNSPRALEIATSMLKDATTFAKNVVTGYSCQNVEQVKSLVTGEVEQEIEHNNYMVLYNPDQPEDISNGKFIESPDGNFLMITVDREFRGNHVVFSIIIKNDEYPEHIHMKGTIVARKTITKEPATFAEICNMNPKPITKICTPFTTTFTLPMNKHSEYRKQTYNSYVRYMEDCTQTV